MKGSETDEDDYPEIAVDHDGDPEQRKIYGHLRALFRLQGLKEEAKHALRCAALLPPEGMHNQLFRKALPESCRNDIQELQRRGWVQSENKLLTIHPVVRLVCRRELSPTVENCGDFLRWFEEQYDQTTYEREKFSQIAALYETASEVLRETDGFWACEAGYLWLVLMESRRALTCNHRAVALLEQNAPNSQGLATAYNNLGTTYGYLGDHEKALEYQLKDLAICEQVLPPNHPSLATSYNNVGTTYGDLGDHEKELEYQLKALGILEQSLPPDHPNIVIFRSNIAMTYAQMDDFIRANEYMRRALDSAERSMGNHPELEMYRQMAQILELCAQCQEQGEPLPFDNPFR
jgi:tetratricopeptide (TPR) repeat protein